ncbi:Putative protein KIAA1683 [Fukomys damarensis]|uniref:Uncharacterized protein n=3 Tax=Gnathostomata TaxID=7776 RepID=A0A091CVJ0_FUKDA|nr:Putative protein KIAA1683 [Fukomys damarensis]
MLVELKNGETYNGHLVSCDNWMNINLREVICTSRDGDKFWRMPECYIRGSTIKYLRIPDEIIDMVKEEVVAKGRGRGGLQQQKQQRGRGLGGTGRGVFGGRGRGGLPGTGRGQPEKKPGRQAGKQWGPALGAACMQLVLNECTVQFAGYGGPGVQQRPDRGTMPCPAQPTGMQQPCNKCSAPSKTGGLCHPCQGHLSYVLGGSGFKGEDEPQTVPEVPSFGESPPLSPIDMDTQERIKAERKRLRNRIAASKCRKRKLERISRLEEKVKTLKSQNTELASTASLLREQAQLSCSGANTMQQAAQLPVENQLSPGGPLPLQPQLTPDVRDGCVEKPAPQPRPGPPGSQQPVPQRVPRLRAVEESQAFKDILVDETHRVAAPTRTPAQTYPAPAVTRTQPQPCPAPNKAYAQVRPTPSPARPTPPVSRTPPQPGSVTMATKTSPQMHLVTTPVGSPLRTTQPATVCKTPPQPGPSSPKTKPPPRMRLAAIITRTPAAHIRSVAAVLKTLCLTLQAPGNPRAPPGAAQQAAGTPGTSPSLHADTPRTRGPANTPQATAGTAKVSDLRCRAEGSVRVAPQPHLESGARGAPTRGPVRTEKTHTGVQKLVNEETGSKAAAQATRAPSWARLAEERSQPLSQMHQRTEVLKVQSQVYVPIQAEVALPRAQVAVPLTKARALGQPPKVSSQAHPHKAQLAVWPPATSHGPPPTEQTKALSQPHLATCPAKASSRAPPSGGLSKAPSLMHLVTCLTRAQPQAQLVTDATRRVWSRVKPDHRQGDMGPERQGMLVPLLAAAAATHPSCNVEPWGNSKTTRAQLPTPSQAAPGQEDMVASQIAALCAELVTMLDSQEDLRVLLTKALSQGEVRAILNQALSSEILGATMAKVLPQSMLGMVLAKALSWGELGTTLSRALPRAELCTELTKAVQGRLAEVLSRALTQEERAALSRALCQGELGAVLSQFLSRAAPRTGAVLPKASSKVTSSKMPLLPAPAWGPGLGSPVWLQSHKVRMRGVGMWGGLAVGAPGDRGDGAALEGPPRWPYFPVSAASSSRTSVSSGPDLLLSCLARWSRVCSNPHLSPEIRKETAHPACRAGELASDANPVVGGGPLSPWQPFITFGIGPSTSRLSVTHGPAPSTQQPPVVSRVAPRTGTSSGEGSAASDRPPGGTGVGQGTPSGPSSPTGQGAACWCQTVGTKKGIPSLPRPSMGRGLRQPSKATQQNLKKAQPPNPRQGFPTISKVTANAQTAAGGRGGGPMSVSTSTWLGQVRPQSPTRQERSPTQGLASGLASSQEPLAGLPGSPLGGQGAHVPSVLAQCTSRGSAPISPGDWDSQSSPSLSTTSTGSVATVEVLDHTGKGSWDQEPRLEALLSQEPVGQPRDPRDPEEAGGASPRSLSLRLPCLPPKDPEHAPVLHHTMVSSRLALSVPWDTEGEEGQSPVGETERTAQGTPQSSPRTLSLGTEVLALGLQPSVAPRFSCLLSQPSLASRGEAAPRAPQKPTPHDWPPSSPAQSPDARRLCKSHQDSLVPALLEGPAAELGPRSPRLDSGLTPESVAQGRSGPRPSRGQESAPQWPLFDQSLPCFTGPRAHHRKLSLTPGSLQAQLPHYFSGPTVSHCKPSLTPGVPQGPVDTGTCDQPCNSPVPSVAVRPLDRFVGPHNMWQPPRGSGLWGRTGQAGTPDWTVSLQHMERVVIRAATVIQACARGCLVRRTIKVWHQRATVIQATWRGHHVRRNLARLYRATVVIQAAWRGHRELWDAAATTIQSAWKGFKVRRQLRKQQSAARMLQATWRGHYTRSCLTPEALLGTGSPWDSAPGAPRLGTRLSLHWPGI